MVVPFFEIRYNKSFISFLAYILLTLVGAMLGLVLLQLTGRGAALSAYGFISSTPSVWGLFLSAFIPLLITFFSIRINNRFVLYLLLIGKTALFSYCTCVLFLIFPVSGWLVQFLTMFSQWLEMSVYHWLWMQLIVFQKHLTRQKVWGCFYLLLLFALFDCFVIYPFTASLFIN